ncbi:MAG: hypothetical protein ACRES7_03955 [Gammaproteobacteria bacterium]
MAVAASAPTPATLSNPKIAPALTAMARRVNAAANGTRAATFFNALIHVNHEGEIEVYIHVTQVAPAVAQALSEAGITNIRVSRPLQVYQGWASPRALGRIAALPQVVRITPPAYRLPKSGGS